MKEKNKKAIFFFLSFIWLPLLLAGCTRFVEVAPPGISITGADVFTDDATAAAVLTGIYTNMSSAGIDNGGLTSVSMLSSLSADELLLFGAPNAALSAYYTNTLNNSNMAEKDFWGKVYPIIFTANSAIEGLSQAKNLTQSVKQQLTGESKFIRAFCYFYLVNLYGDLPLATGTDYTINSVALRIEKAKIWEQIIADLKEAQELLSADYLDGNILSTSSERVRPTKWAAAALLARSYLYTYDYVNAEAQATSVINNKDLYDTVPLNQAFLKNNREAVWQLQPVFSGFNTQDARIFVLPDSGPSQSFPVYINSFLLNAFETGDRRKDTWISNVTANGITYYYPFKYRISKQGEPVNEYNTVLRLGEQYLIRAEARAQQNHIADAVSDVNIIRKRAGLPEIIVSTQETVLTVIQHERQAELFTEWGHRWLDLKRTGNVDEVMIKVTPLKGGSWNSDLQLYPVSLSELRANPNLVQNKGY